MARDDTTVSCKIGDATEYVYEDDEEEWLRDLAVLYSYYFIYIFYPMVPSIL